MQMKVLKQRGQPPEPGEKLYEKIVKDEFVEFCALLKTAAKNKTDFFEHHDTIIVTACKNELWPLPQEKYYTIIKYVDEFLKIKPTVQLLAFLIAHGENQRAITYLESYLHFQKDEYVLMQACCESKNTEIFNYLDKETLKRKMSKNLLINTALKNNFPYEWLEKQSLDPVFIIEGLLNQINHDGDKVNLQCYLQLLKNTFSNMNSFNEIIANYIEKNLQAKNKMKMDWNFDVQYPEGVVWKQYFYHQADFTINYNMLNFMSSDSKELAGKFYLKVMLENDLKEKVKDIRGNKI